MKNKQTLWGVPIDEAQKVIEVYKYTHKMPSQDYQEGFEAGVKYMRDYMDMIIAEELKNMLEVSDI